MIDLAPPLAGMIAGVSGGLLAFYLARRAVADPPGSLLRENHRGKSVAAVLGPPLIAAGAVGPALLLTVDIDGVVEVAAGIIALIGSLGIAGLWDDLRGDERQRGFKGHLRAARRLRLTGGLVKLVTGGLAGLAVSAFLIDGAPGILLSAAIIALSANLVNLFDRAPGRAGKVALIFLIPLFLSSPLGWRIGTAGLLGGLLVLMPFDLKEKGMLGDAGANPLGAVIGLGLSLTLANAGRATAAALLLAVNLASEKWSFSRGIKAVPILAHLDALGQNKKSPR